MIYIDLEQRSDDGVKKLQRMNSYQDVMGPDRDGKTDDRLKVYTEELKKK